MKVGADREVEQFAKFTHAVMTDSSLSLAARVVWAYLRYRQGNNDFAWPSIETIAVDLGLDRKTILRAKKSLEDAELLAIVHSDGGKSNRYSCIIPPNRPKNEPVHARQSQKRTG